MRDAETFGDARCVAHILSRAAGPLAAGRGAVVIKLQCDADDIEPGARQQTPRPPRSSTPPDIATTTRVRDGSPERSRLFGMEGPGVMAETCPQI